MPLINASGPPVKAAISHSLAGNLEVSARLAEGSVEDTRL